MFKGLPPRKPSNVSKAQELSSIQDQGLDEGSFVDERRPCADVPGFAASMDKKVVGAQPAWLEMDLSLMPQDIVEELRTEFEAIEVAKAGTMANFPRKLRAIDEDSENQPESQNETNEVIPFTRPKTVAKQKVLGRLLTANWERVPDPLKEQIQQFLVSDQAVVPQVITQILPTGPRRKGIITGRALNNKKPVVISIVTERAFPAAPVLVKKKSSWIEMDWTLLSDALQEELNNEFSEPKAS